VHLNPFRSTHFQSHVRRWLREGGIRKVALSLLATTLITGVVTPAVAGTPHHGHASGRHEPQSRDLSIAKKHHGKSKTVTKSFSTSAAIAIPAEDADQDFGPADPYPSSIDVTGFKQGTITDLNLTLRGFSHTYPADIDVLLVAPGGDNMVVMGDVGSDIDASDLTLTLDDEAASPLPSRNDEALTSGTFQPLDQFGLTDRDDPAILDFPAPAPAPSGDLALSTFDGGNPDGQWQLFILDDSKADSGALADGWSLEITAQVTTKKHKH
jgi:subtilisin-like proprotein convertase family protein